MYVPAIAALAAVYFVAGKLGLTLAFVHASATAVWPPTGIAIAAFLLFGYAVWPGILLGAFVVNLTTAGSALSSVGIATGNTLEGAVAAYLVNRFANGRHAFEHLQNVFKFALLAAMVSTAVSATFGVTSLSATGFADWSEFGAIWLTWWLGDAGGAVVVAPLLILWISEPRVRWAAGRAIESLVLLGAIVLTGFAVFGGLDPLSVNRYPLEFLAFPALVWAAFRFGPREAAAAIALLATIAIWGTLQHFGPFARDTQNESLLLLQAFMGVAAVMSLALAAAVLDRRRAEEKIHDAEARLRQIDLRKVAERDEFLSVAAHELKTPMTSLQMAVQFLLRQTHRGAAIDPPQLERALALVEEQSGKLARLVSALLETVRLRVGRPPLELQVVDVAALVARLVGQAQTMTSRHELVLSGPPRLMAGVDALRFEQVVTNLLDNSIKFSPNGGRIEVELSAPDAYVIRFVVRDHGLGIPPEHRARVFEPFHQAHPDSQRSGLGLGLHVSRQIVELHGGSIEMELPGDGGARVVVSLPCRADAPVGGPTR